MFTKHANQKIDYFVAIHWLLMSGCAGILNAVAFIGFGTFATHVTGFGTLIGIHASEFRWGHAFAALAVPSFFLIGAIVSGLCVEARVRRDKAPHYDYVMYFCSFLLFLACVVGTNRNMDVVQTYLHVKKNFFLLSSICLASGLINAALSYSSRSTVRITHLTGITTDLGRGIAEYITLRLANRKKPEEELRINLLRAMTIGSFIIGSLVGAFGFRAIHFYILIVPAIFFLYAGRHGRTMKTNDLVNPPQRTPAIQK